MNNIYETPKANLDPTMEPRLGGWLQIFRIINIFSVVIISVFMSFIVIVYLMFEEDIVKTGDLISLIEQVPGLIFPFLIFKIIKYKLEETPNKIKKYLWFELVANLVAGTVVYYYYQQGIIEDRPYPFIMSVIYYLIWSNYFKKSKRVKLYYGKNAD